MRLLICMEQLQTKSEVDNALWEGDNLAFPLPVRNQSIYTNSIRSNNAMSDKPKTTTTEVTSGTVTRCPFSKQPVSDEEFRALYAKEMASREWIKEMKAKIPD